MHSAILIIGPTGSGKTPLGNALERHGLWNQQCIHFDFGHQLRLSAATGTADRFLTPDELVLIRQLLRTGALLEDEQFPIARKILSAFLRERSTCDDDIIILNGLPRHLGQAAPSTTSSASPTSSTSSARPTPSSNVSAATPAATAAAVSTTRSPPSAANSPPSNSAPGPSSITTTPAASPSLNTT